MLVAEKNRKSCAQVAAKTPKVAEKLRKLEKRYNLAIFRLIWMSNTNRTSICMVIRTLAAIKVCEVLF